VTPIRTRILDLVASRVVLILNDLLTSPPLLARQLLGSPPFVPGRMTIIERSLLGNYLARVRIYEIAFSCLWRRILNELLRADSEGNTTCSRINIADLRPYGCWGRIVVATPTSTAI
jgi:hypothetical protein